MWKPKSEKLADNHNELETINVGLLNISETSETMIKTNFVKTSSITLQPQISRNLLKKTMLTKQQTAG